MKNFYSMVDVHIARETMSLYGKLDRFGNPMVELPHVLWAAKVLIWFNNYMNKVRQLMRNLRTTWNNAVSKVWRGIKSLSILIPDTP